MSWITFAATHTPSPTSTIVQPPAAGTFETVAAALAIVLAVGAGILGYRIIRGGRGL
ncbi:MAG TPA: hypothetical protein VNP73_01305 [Actinomycetota bacterium]|nr:hypothetical protein [Actinomycetota bacterium]